MMTIADLPTLEAFKNQCEGFKVQMDRSKKKLANAISAARSGWDDEGYRRIQGMVSNVGDEVETIENTVCTMVIPFVQSQIDWLKSKPY